eukprot:scaffold9529_cov80-Skeletonema_menzelii.AAC.2
MGWNRHVCTANFKSKKKKDAWMSFTKCIHAWLYSFSRPGYCLSAEEYEISKHLLISCLTSEHALKMAGGNKILVSKAVDFVRKYVFPYEQYYLFHLRQKIFHLDVMCSSPHEGLHNGMKTCAAAVNGCMKLDTAAAAMSAQDDTKVSELDLKVGHDFRNRDKSSWSTSPTAPFLLSYAEGLVLYSYKKAKWYKVRRIGPTTFQVVFVGKGCDPAFVQRYINGWGDCVNFAESDQDADIDSSESDNDDIFEKRCMPLFSRVYTVDLNGTCSTCDCFLFLRAGYFCPHMVACANEVCRSCGTNFDGFKLDSVSIRWRTDFMYYGYSVPDSSEEEDLVKIFHHLAHKDVKGPKFEVDIPSCMPIQERIEPLPALKRIKNYPQNAILELFKNFDTKFDSLLSTTHVPSSSQQLDEALQDDILLLESIDMLRGSGGSVFEKMLDDAHAEISTSLHEVDAAIAGASSYRASLYPLFNELTDNLKKVNDPELAREVETEFRSLIDRCQKRILEKTLTSGNGDGDPLPTSPTYQSGNKRPFVSVVGSTSDGQGRVLASRNSQW